MFDHPIVKIDAAYSHFGDMSGGRGNVVPDAGVVGAVGTRLAIFICDRRNS